MLTRKAIIVITLILCPVWVFPALATTRYVSQNGSDNADGLSWATAFATVQKGIRSSSTGDIVEVNEGTYYEALDFSPNGPGISCIVKSTDPNDWVVVSATVINANGLTNAVTFDSGSLGTLSGFTVTGGTRGFYCTQGSSTITNCIIRNNTDEGVKVYQGASSIRNCYIQDNGTEGICAENANVTVKNSIIYGNNEGIKINQYVTMTARNNTIVNNTSFGIYSGATNTPTISNCILWNNSDDLYNCSANYSCIEDGDTGTGNISSYPYFSNYTDNDFHLSWNSPCINKGNPGTGTGETDIDDEERVVNDRVDIGADEMDNSANLIQNPGFELGGGGLNSAGQTDPTVPLYWQDKWLSATKSIDSDAHSGNHSWKFTNNGSWSSGAYSDFIKINNENAYEYSVWLKAEGTDPVFHIGVEEYNKDYNSIGTYYWLANGMKGPMGWTQISRMYRICHKGAEYIKLRFFGPYRTSGTAWWDDFYLKDLGTAYLPAYGCVNEPNLSLTVDFGGSEDNIGWVKNYSTNMGGKETDSNDENITYRKLLAGKNIDIEFPAFDADSNGLPNGPMLLEVMFKDTVGNESVYSHVSYDLIQLSSKVGWIYPDPCYLISDTNNRYCLLTNFGGFNDNKWKYTQTDFQKSDFQQLRAVNGKYTIRISNATNWGGTTSYDVPIDYVCLRKISDSEWQSLYERQRDLKFKKVELADKCDNCSYDDPNLVVFCRDYMHPVYKDTRPAENEPDSISTFSAWGEVEPVSFSIYSEGGVDDLTVTVSDLTNGNSVIDSDNISIWRVVYDEARLGYAVYSSTVPSMDYALVPDRLEKFSGTLSVAAGTSESVWLKINVPAESDNLSAGVYNGQVHIQKAGVYDKTINITLTIYDITLETPSYLNYIYHDPYRYCTTWGYMSYSENIDKTFDAYAETKFDPAITSGQYLIKVLKDANQQYNVAFDSNTFEMGLDRMITEGFANRKVNILSDFSWTTIYYYATGKSGGGTNIWAQLSDPCFCAAYGQLINRYCEIGNARGIEFIFHVTDEPGSDPYRRIICDRLYTIMKDTNYVDANNKITTGVTYYSTCDLPALPGDYNVPTADHNIPPLTNLVDDKIWSLSNEPIAYLKHQDSNYHGNMGYYTTGYSHYRNPVYNRFLHGLFAYTTDACSVACYAMGDYIGDMYNDFDPSVIEVWPFTYPDFLLGYPTWNGEIYHTIGGLEAIREGIKDGRYFATLKKLIAEKPNNAVAQVAQEYLDELKQRVNPSYSVYTTQGTEIGHYQAILKEISLSSDPNDYEVFTEIRQQLAEFIELLMDGNDYSVWNVNKNKYYMTIQGGINGSSNGDELIAAKKTHHESISFGGKAITLRSADPNDWDVVAATVIDGNGAANTVVAHSNLSGFTITDGNCGVYCTVQGATSPVVSNCIIRNNNDKGVRAYSCGATVKNCIIYGNGGEGIYTYSAGLTATNNLIYDNNEGMYFQYGGGTVRNNTIVDNTSYGIRCGMYTGATISNCIIWNINADDLSGCSATYSCIEDGDAGKGNISFDPCFVDNDFFHIGIQSPCINGGDPCGSYTNEADIDGEARVIGRCVDIGADEVNFNAPEPNGHWWKLDEANGVTAYDSVGTTDGTFNGNDPCWVNGHIGGAADFNGVSDYFSVSSLDGVSFGYAFTVAGWFETSQSTGNQTIVGNWAQYWYHPVPGVNIDAYYGWQVLVEDNNIKAMFATGSPTTPYCITGSSNVFNNGWHHFAITYPSYPTFTPALYVDGYPQGTSGATYISTSNTKFRIGDGSYVISGNPILEGGPFCGMIDDVMIFNRALTANEVEQLYLAGR